MPTCSVGLQPTISERNRVQLNEVLLKWHQQSFPLEGHDDANNEFVIKSPRDKSWLVFKAEREFAITDENGAVELEVMSGVVTFEEGLTPTVFFAIEHERGARMRIAEDYRLAHNNSDAATQFRALTRSAQLDLLGY